MLIPTPWALIRFVGLADGHLFIFWVLCPIKCVGFGQSPRLAEDYLAKSQEPESVYLRDVCINPPVGGLSFECFG